MNGQNQDIASRLRALTERTRKTRCELEELILRSEVDRTRAFFHDKAHEPPQFFRRRRERDEK